MQDLEHLPPSLSFYQNLDFHFEWSADKTYACIALFVFFLVTVVAYLIVAKQNGGRYICLFEMDEKHILHRQMKEQFKKAQATAWLTGLVGIATGNLSMTGLSIINSIRDSMISEFKDVRKIKTMRMFHLIKVNNRFQHNQVYVCNEDYDFVVKYIKEHVAKERGEN